MLHIPEAAQWLPQNTPALLEAKGPLMLPEVARQLGLNETQVVEAVARVRGERMELFLNGRSIEVPPGWRMSPGQTVWLTAHSTTQGLWVLRQHASAAVAQRALHAASAKASMAAASPAGSIPNQTPRPTPSGAQAVSPSMSSEAAPVKPDPAAAAAAARVERAKVVLEARAQGEDPLRVLARRAASEGEHPVSRAAARVDVAEAKMPAATAAPVRDAGVRSSAAPQPAHALNTSLAPYWRATQSQASGPAPVGVPPAPHLSTASALQPWSLGAPRGEPSLSTMPGSGAAAVAEVNGVPAYASVPAKWAQLWTQAAAPADLIDWQHASPRLRELAAHPPGMQTLMQVFQPQALAVLLQTPGLAQWAQLVFRDRLSMRNPDSTTVKAIVECGLKPSEAQLAKGMLAPPNSHDQRALLGDLLRLLREQGDPRASTVRAALSDVESAQWDHLRALQQQRDWSFQCVLPFADGPAVQLHLQRAREEADVPGTWTHKWWVSLYTESERLGQVWMRSGVSAASEVEMQVWATHTHVVDDARARVEDLRDLLAEAGLRLSHFVVTPGEKPSAPLRAPPPHGAVLDKQA